MKISQTFLAVSIIGGSLFASSFTSIQVLADEHSSNSAIINTSTIDSNKLSFTDINRFDKYVLFDQDTLQFTLTSEASSRLSAQELTRLQKQLDETNYHSSKIVLNSNESLQKNEKGFVITQIPNSSARFKEGKNDLKFYWWGIRVWLTKSTVNYIGGGITIAGIWIPEPFVSKVLATAGVVIGFCPGGIAFNSTPGISSFWGLEFQ